MVVGQKHGPALDAPRPNRVTETRDEGGLTLAYRWLTLDHLLTLCFCIVWDGALYFWYSMALSEGVAAFDSVYWFPLPHVVIGICFTYYTLAGFLNRTHIVVAGGDITVRHGPLPWLGNQTLPTAILRQLYREETFSGRSGRTAHHHVSMLTTDSRKLRLVSNVPGADVALYLEHALETEFGLKDRRVMGEMPK